jgi:hypothetical protein
MVDRFVAGVRRNASFSPPDFVENICFDGFLLTESLEIEVF